MGGAFDYTLPSRFSTDLHPGRQAGVRLPMARAISRSRTAREDDAKGEFSLVRLPDGPLCPPGLPETFTGASV